MSNEKAVKIAWTAVAKAGGRINKTTLGSRLFANPLLHSIYKPPRIAHFLQQNGAIFDHDDSNVWVKRIASQMVAMCERSLRSSPNQERQREALMGAIGQEFPNWRSVFPTSAAFFDSLPDRFRIFRRGTLVFVQLLARSPERRFDDSDQARSALCPPILPAADETIDPIAADETIDPIQPECTTQPSLSNASLRPAATIIDNALSCAEALAIIMQQSEVAVDCEGVPDEYEGAQAGQLCLVQVGAADRVFLFDFVAARRNTDNLRAVSSAVCQIVEGNLFKVFHDVRADITTLRRHTNLKAPLKIVDTQTMHALLQSGPDRGRIGLAALLKWYGQPSHSNKHEMHERMNADPLLWTRRPLSPELIEYAAMDVRHLVAVALEQFKAFHSRVVMSIVDLCKESDVAHTVEALPESIRGPRHIVAFTRDGGLCPVIEEELEPAARARQWWLERMPWIEMDAMDDLLRFLPQCLSRIIVHAVQQKAQTDSTARFIELVCDIGRVPSIRFSDRTTIDLPAWGDVDAKLLGSLVRSIDHQLAKGDAFDYDIDGEDEKSDEEDTAGHPRWPFTTDNRTGLPGSLHRISATISRTRGSHVVQGLLMRVGRHVKFAAEALRDIFTEIPRRLDSDKQLISCLLLGPPGVGKTTLLVGSGSTKITLTFLLSVARRVPPPRRAGCQCGYCGHLVGNCRLLSDTTSSCGAAHTCTTAA